MTIVTMMWMPKAYLFCNWNFVHLTTLTHSEFLQETWIAFLRRGKQDKKKHGEESIWLLSFYEMEGDAFFYSFWDWRGGVWQREMRVIISSHPKPRKEGFRGVCSLKRQEEQGLDKWKMCLGGNHKEEKSLGGFGVNFRSSFICAFKPCWNSSHLSAPGLTLRDSPTLCGREAKLTEFPQQTTTSGSQHKPLAYLQSNGFTPPMSKVSLQTSHPGKNGSQSLPYFLLSLWKQKGGQRQRDKRV